MAKKNIEKSQPEINIGLIGHVDHGKTTLTERLSGKWTDTHSEEVKRGITIRLGYADAVFSKCRKCSKYTVEKKCPECGSAAEPVRKVSFVDAPGHESLMATMLGGATMMDGALLLISANEECPQPQTREHLMALQIIGIKNLIVVQNKIDLVDEEKAIRNHKQIRDFLKETNYKNAPIIPVSAQHGVNIDILIEAIEKKIPTPKRNPKKKPLLYVARSFDVNKPGSKSEKIVGGILGGILVQGILKSGDKIEIKPGRKVTENNQVVYKPLTTSITDIKTGGLSVKQAGPGGSIGVMTSLDPAIVKSDNLTGSVLGRPGTLPKVWNELNLEIHLLERVVGTDKDLEVEPIKMSEPLMLNVNSSATVGIVTKLGKDEIICKLKIPVCAETGSRVTISRQIGTRFRLIGYGIIS